MSKLLFLQQIIALVSTSLSFLLVGFYLMENKYECKSFNNDCQYYALLASAEILNGLLITYAILKFFWNAVTCCWSDGNERSSFSCFNALFLLGFFIIHMTLIYYIKKYNINFNDKLVTSGWLLSGNVLFVIGIGIIFSFIRKFCNSSKKRDYPKAEEKYNELE